MTDHGDYWSIDYNKRSDSSIEMVDSSEYCIEKNEIRDIISLGLSI